VEEKQDENPDHSKEE